MTFQPALARGWHKGYTLVELMVTVTIITLLTGFGVSAYSKAKISQDTKSATELIMTALVEAQKKATTGTTTCASEYAGQRVDFQASNIKTTPVCKSGNVYSDGTPVKNTPITGVVITGSPSLTFRPLNQGAQMGSEPTSITYTNGVGDDYLIQVFRSGSIINQGKQGP